MIFFMQEVSPAQSLENSGSQRPFSIPKPKTLNLSLAPTGFQVADSVAGFAVA